MYVFAFLTFEILWITCFQLNQPGENKGPNSLLILALVFLAFWFAVGQPAFVRPHATFDIEICGRPHII